VKRLLGIGKAAAAKISKGFFCYLIAGKDSERRLAFYLVFGKVIRFQKCL
jgi:hypothetical protein